MTDKKKKKKTELQVLGWATAQNFLSLSHNTASCIVTGKAGRQRIEQATIRPLLAHDMTMARLRYDLQQARGAWLGVSVTIQSFVS